MDKLRNTLRYFKMVQLAKEAEISYEILKNFKQGRKEHLTDEEYNKVVAAIYRISGGIR